jgi:glucose-6-phosphate 1-dehydrogenase
MQQTTGLPPASGQADVRVADPCVLVIFGASGDLTRRKLVPALVNLARDGLLSREFAIVGCATRELSTEAFRAALAEGVTTFGGAAAGDGGWHALAERVHYVRGSVDDPDTYQRLATAVADIAQALGSGNGVNLCFYLAVAPQHFANIVCRLGAAGMTREEAGRWRRVVIEKPFGRDLDSARALNTRIKDVLAERQIYRIDHYLGKETVQNLMVFRFGNGIFEPIWNRRYIDHVEITSAETVGVETRGSYYDQSGALRDMVPNHLFQLLTLTAMEPPISFNANAVRDEQAKVLNSIQPFAALDVLSRTVRGQYDAGVVDGRQVAAYRSEPNVAPDSATETYVALEVAIDNWRWAGVPFYVRTGKRLACRATYIVIQFRRAPFVLFRHTTVADLTANQLVIRIHPSEGISLRFGAKIPGMVMRQEPVEMDFSYADHFGVRPSTGYERLLYDCMIGDQTLFQRADMVEAGWNLVTPVLDVWRALPPRSFPNYAAGTAGPREADELLARAGRAWREF